MPDEQAAALYVEKLLAYALEKGLIERMDVIPCRNALLDLLRLPEPYMGREIETDDDLDGIIGALLAYAVSKGIIPDSAVERELFSTRIVGLLMPRASEVVKTFNHIRSTQGVEAATDWFYNLSVASNYVKLSEARQNMTWTTTTEYGPLVITINVAKPEKDPRDIERERDAQSSRYPRCLLCIDNVGFSGNVGHPARQNLRVIPVTLGGEEWYLQYSPYSYYDEHCILVYRGHVPMRITPATFERLLEFVEQYRHYFMGSNADLPIVGGSILSHEHYQGGKYIFPMESAPAERHFSHPSAPQVVVDTIRWPLSVIRLTSADKEALVDVAAMLTELWRGYEDEESSIRPYSEKDGQMIMHNTVTPVARMLPDGEFRLYIVLRNNRTSEEHPWGIFHPHEQLHHIKKENIGLIEVMGLAILPGRLKGELEKIASILTGRQSYDKNQVLEDSILAKHGHWIEELIGKYGTDLTPDEAWEVLKHEVGSKFLQVLLDCGVFKRHANGQKAFARFLLEAGFREVD